MTHFIFHICDNCDRQVGFTSLSLSRLVAHLACYRHSQEPIDGRCVNDIFMNWNLEIGNQINTNKYIQQYSREKYRCYPCQNFIISGGCPYYERCTFLHDMIVANKPRLAVFIHLARGNTLRE